METTTTMCAECKRETIRLSTGQCMACAGTEFLYLCKHRNVVGQCDTCAADADRDRKAADYDRLRDENEALRKLKRCGEGETAESCWLCGEGHRPGQYLHTCSRCGSLVCEECSEDDGNDESVCYQLALDQYARKTAAVSDACAELAEARAAVEALRRERDAATARAEALEAALRQVGKCRACVGKGVVYPYCFLCSDSTHDHVCPDEEPCGPCRGSGMHPAASAALDTTPPADPAQHPAYRAGVEAAAKVCDGFVARRLDEANDDSATDGEAANAEAKALGAAACARLIRVVLTKDVRDA